MRRRPISLSLLLGFGLAFAQVTTGVAQEATERDAGSMQVVVVCMTVTRPVSDTPLTAAALRSMLESGEATVDAIGGPADCLDPEAGAAQSSGDTSDGGSSIGPERAGQVEVVETFFTKLGDNVNYLAIFENTDPDSWVAKMWFRVDVVDKKGRRTGFTYDRLELDPGGRTAMSGFIVDAKKADDLVVILAEHPSSYVPVDAGAAAIELSKIKTKVKRFEGPKTTGVMAGVPEGTLGVWVQAVYRNKKGKIIGFGSTYVDSPSDGIAFETVGAADGKVAKTEVYTRVIG